jgi:hypothetical protein
LAFSDYPIPFAAIGLSVIMKVKPLPPPRDKTALASTDADAG